MAVDHFQYPLSDRSDWNDGTVSIAYGKDGPFSIHYRIEVIETSNHRVSEAIREIFQYPLSDRSDWNPSYRISRHAPIRLSVSTIGSKWLKLRWSCRLCQRKSHFQYPLSDRSDWNSVWCLRVGGDDVTFSIHYRIEVIETWCQCHSCQLT